MSDQQNTTKQTTTSKESWSTLAEHLRNLGLTKAAVSLEDELKGMKEKKKKENEVNEGIYEG